MTVPDWAPSQLQGSQHSYERLMGALAASDACVGVLEEARRALVEAHHLVVAGLYGDAIMVLERGIRDAEYALNIREEPGE